MVAVVGGLQAEIGENRSNMGKFFTHIIFIVMLIGIIGVTGCTTSSTPTPKRNFTRSDLLVLPTQMPVDMRSGYTYSDEPAHALDIRNNLGGSSIQLHGPITSVDQIVATFSNAQDASIAYRYHDYSRDTDGIFPMTWHVIPGWNYASPIADQFRVVCAEVENTSQNGDLCVIEAQYEEFLSIVIFNNISPDRTVGDLLLIAKAVDERMVEFLGK
jgi:hypothetical protein